MNSTVCSNCDNHLLDQGHKHSLAGVKVIHGKKATESFRTLDKCRKNAIIIFESSCFRKNEKK